MPYAKILNTILEQSGVTVKEIEKRCKAQGVEITSSYISALRHPESHRVASDEVSRALAIACGVKENILIVEAGIDKAPQEIIDFLTLTKNSMAQGVLGLLKDTVSNEQFEMAKLTFANLSLSQMIIATLENPTQMGVVELTEDNIIKINADNLMDYDVEDEAMKPILNKGQKVQLDTAHLDEIKTGDIIYLKVGRAFQFRKIIFLDDEKKNILLMPINSDYGIVPVSLCEIEIIGKVSRVITELE